jgi:hypothetical protein
MSDLQTETGEPVAAGLPGLPGGAPAPNGAAGRPTVPLTREAILGAQDRPPKRVWVPEWGGHVWIRTLSGIESERYNYWITENRKPGGPLPSGWMARICQMGLVDEHGNQLFTEADIDALMTRSSSVILRLVNKINDESGIGDEAEGKLEKN